MMQRINLLCPTIRRKSRKIGRNEDCPCGRTKTRRVLVDVVTDVYKYVSLDANVGALVSIPMKFKHCCGSTSNMKLVTKAKRNIANVIRKALGHKKNRRSLLQRLASFFKKKD
jgi:hypothetical protein